MNQEQKIKGVKGIRIKLQGIVEEIAQSETQFPTPKSDDGFYAASIAKRKIKEARMWLGMSLNALGNNTPYIHSDNPENAIVSPEADVPKASKLSLVKFRIFENGNNNINYNVELALAIKEDIVGNRFLYGNEVYEVVSQPNVTSLHVAYLDEDVKDEDIDFVGYLQTAEQD